MCIRGQGPRAWPLRGGVSARSEAARPPLATCHLPLVRLQAGFSLIETVVFMLVIGIALAVLVNVFSLAATANADPLPRRQALAIAQALIEEVSYNAAANPPGGFAGPYTAANRNRFDDVMDYNGLTLNGITDLSNAPLVGLEAYRAQVSVAATAFGAVPAAAGFRITVSVTDPRGETLALDGYRANY